MSKHAELTFPSWIPPGPARVSAVAALLLLGWTAIAFPATGGRSKIVEGVVLARLLPLRWMGLPMMADKEYGLKKIAQMEVSFARAEYVSADNKSEASLELLDTIHSPMHENDFYSMKKNTVPEQLEAWSEDNLEGYLIQDVAENETWARVLLSARFLLTITVSPRVKGTDLHLNIEALLDTQGFQDLLKSSSGGSD